MERWHSGEAQPRISRGGGGGGRAVRCKMHCAEWDSHGEGGAKSCLSLSMHFIWVLENRACRRTVRERH